MSDIVIEQKDRWVVYIVECADATFYTGITNNLAARIQKHNDGLGAKYTKGRGPVRLVCSWEMASRSEAAKEEYRIKRLSKNQKIKLIEATLLAD